MVRKNERQPIKDMGIENKVEGFLKEKAELIFKLMKAKG